MTFQNLFIPHERREEEERWLAEEIEEQKKRYEEIVRAMDALEPTRERWYAEFLQRIQTRGFNVDGDQRVKIPPEDIPLRPDRPHKVVY
ncbi:MAG TPA: hypothetical protein VGE08_15105 [Steroidobacter sp.]|uniref:hypothetical protein n=1 Tax=Steroidobacter sp. TaxID=1978227 RepID=UPI002ED895A0